MQSAVGRFLLLPSVLLASSLSYALGSSLQLRDTPQPVQFAPDQNWDGIDGAWSSFTIRIGTPPQYVRTFVSWAVYQTWAVIPAGCNTSANYQDCSNARGWIYTQTKSKTYDNIGLYALSVESNLGYEGNAFFGYDTVGLGGPGEEGPTLQHTVVGGMAYDDFYLGVFGINPKPSNFTSFNQESTSFMTLLKDQKYIPSVSFGYTAGAPYRYTGVLASLTLGGYDAAKFVENDVTFTFAPDNSRDIVVAIQTITTPWDASAHLLPSAIYAYMDATVAEIWLPLEACKAFESVFGLTYDTATELYLVSNSLHQQLLKQDPSIVFTLGTDLNSGKTVSIELPYSAFDLTAQPPYRGLSEQSLYFPLRRAENETQYTIGRTFFQEAYITIDYETQTFNVSQCKWQQNPPTDIVTIPPGTAEQDAGYPGVSSSSSSSISVGAIAGIVVGIVLLFAVIGLAFIWFKRSFQLTRRGAHEKLDSDWGSTSNADTNLTPIYQIRRVSQSRRTSSSTHTRTETQQDVVFPKAELAGSEPGGSSSQPSIHVRSPGGFGSDGVITPRTPHGLANSPFASASHSTPSSPSDGCGTYSSASGGQGTMMSCVSPMVANEEQQPVYEMAGDMPPMGEKDGQPLSEKDGKELTEKEAIAHREKVYNGVELPKYSEESPVTPHPRTPLGPGDVVTGGVVVDYERGLAPAAIEQHRAFSFEEARSTRGEEEGHGTYDVPPDGEDDLYS